MHILKRGAPFSIPYNLGVMDFYKLSNVLDIMNDDSVTVGDMFNQL